MIEITDEWESYPDPNWAFWRLQVKSSKEAQSFLEEYGGCEHREGNALFLGPLKEVDSEVAENASKILYFRERVRVHSPTSMSRDVWYGPRIPIENSIRFAGKLVEMERDYCKGVFDGAIKLTELVEREWCPALFKVDPDALFLMFEAGVSSLEWGRFLDVVNTVNQTFREPVRFEVTGDGGEEVYCVVVGFG